MKKKSVLQRNKEVKLKRRLIRESETEAQTDLRLPGLLIEESPEKRQGRISRMQREAQVQLVIITYIYI